MLHSACSSAFGLSYQVLAEFRLPSASSWLNWESSGLLGQAVGSSEDSKETVSRAWGRLFPTMILATAPLLDVLGCVWW